MTFPEDKVELGRYLGPSMNVGPALTAKLLKANGQVVHWSTYRPLTPDELRDPIELKSRDIFDKCVEEKCGEAALASDFEFDRDIETPMFEVYEDDEDHIGYVAEDDDVTPETLDKYVGAEVVLPIGTKTCLAESRQGSGAPMARLRGLLRRTRSCTLGPMR